MHVWCKREEENGREMMIPRCIKRREKGCELQERQKKNGMTERGREGRKGKMLEYAKSRVASILSREEGQENKEKMHAWYKRKKGREWR